MSESVRQIDPDSLMLAKRLFYTIQRAILKPDRPEY